MTLVAQQDPVDAAAAAVTRVVDPIRPLFAVGGLYTEASGVTRIVCDLANALGRNGAPTTVYTAVCHGRQAAEHLLTPPSRCVAEPGRWLGRLSGSSRLRSTLERDVERFDVVHCHSVWMLPNHYASQAARRHRRPVIFTAHGALEPWAVRHSRWKKRVVGAWFQDRDLGRAACIHVNSEREAEGIGAYGLRNPIAIVPNGVDLAAFDSLPSRQAFGLAQPEVAGKRVLLFLARLHPKKGLEPLLHAWRAIGKDHRGWHLVIAGPDDGFEQSARRLIDDCGIDQVTLTGPLYGPDKLAALAAADAFALPSFSEGFSMGVLEAMACSLPVLITPACNFPQVARGGTGLEADPEPKSLEGALRELCSMSDEQRRMMGAGRRMVEEKYTWDAVARQMIDLYRWLIGGGTCPETVQHR